jgi:hypothetical protein
MVMGSLDVLELGDEGLVASAAPTAVDCSIDVDPVGGYPHILLALYPSVSQFAGSLDTMIQVLEGGGTGVRIGEVLDEDGAGLLPRVDVVRERVLNHWRFAPYIMRGR